jgi:sorbitol/mannitol transport system permease protein
MAFTPTPKTHDVLMWMLSTKMMPAAGVLVPMYLIFLNTGLLDTLLGLTIILTLINLPIVVWMLYTYFKEIPVDILEAARMDGANCCPRNWSMCCCPWPCRASPRRCCSTSFSPGTRRSGRSRLSTTGNAAPLTAFIASFSSSAGPVPGQAFRRFGAGHRCRSCCWAGSARSSWCVA